MHTTPFTRSFRLLAAALALALLVLAAQPARAAEEPRTIRVGIFITNLFDINFARQDVEAQFWLWFNHTDPAFEPEKHIEIVNARSVKTLSMSRTDAGDKGLWDQVKYSTVLNETWHVANYPFDRQKIRIIIESTEDDARKALALALKTRFDVDAQIPAYGDTLTI